MKSIKVILFAIIPLFIASCGINKYPFINEPVQTRVNLSKNNYRIVKMVEGTASATYVFGIGGLSKAALAGNAIADMYKNANLTGHQQVIDITTAYSTKFILIYMKRLCTAQGYVIEFLQDNGEPIPSIQSTSLSPQSTSDIDKPLDENAFVDLGLPSGTKWKVINESGYYTYDEAIEKFGNQLPTEKQFKELQSACIWKWTGKGYKVIGPNEQSIYMNANGSYDCEGKIGNKNIGFCWVSSTGDHDNAVYFTYDSHGRFMASYLRCYGLSIHLVE